MKKNFGFWSYSSHLKNKVFPSIKKNKSIIPIKVYTSKKRLKKNNYFLNSKIEKNKENFLKNKDIDIVYISSITKNHFKNALDCIKFNKNVICEKPICENSKDLIKLLNLSKKKKLKIFEVYQYTYHPLFLKIKELIKKKEIGNINLIKSSFTIPLNDKKNFRFKKNLGGGALMDVGIYPISLPFFLFKNIKFKIINKKIFVSKQNKIDTRGSIIANINNNCICHFSWGFNLEYQNYIKLFGKKGMMECDFIFSKKIIQGGKIKIFKKKEKEYINIKKSNQINLAFNSYIKAKDNLKNNRISLNILKTLEKIKK